MKKKAGILGTAFIIVTSIALLTGCSSMPYDDMDLSEYVQVSEYKGIEVEKASVKVTKADVTEEIKSKLEEAGEERNLTAADILKEGDKANIDYVGTLDGTPFEGGTASNYELELGSGTFIEGFEAGLVGHKVGEENIKLNLAFPLNYHSEDLRGKDVVFTVRINSAKRQEKADYDMDFVKTQGEYDSKKEYEKAVKKELVEEKEDEIKYQQQTKIWQTVLTGTEVKKYPEEIVNNYVEVFKTRINNYAESSGSTKKEVMAQMFNVASETELKDVAEEMVKEEMVAAYIADKENIKYTDKEAENMENNISRMGYDEDSIKEETGRTMEECVYMSLIQQKVMEFLLDNAKIK